ncbi:energy transducer TonB [Mucilaginibacter sp.]|uniref:energy transducer TonB n=1 Tax=Mucilaginibacter sp. TaxID=1882438 RepID=UPI002ED55BE5
MRNLFVFGLIMFPITLFAQGKSKKEHAKPDTTIYTSADVVPEFPGGLEKMGAYLSKIPMPPLDTTENIQGRVIIQMIVEKDGSLTHLKAIRGGNSAMDKAYIEYIGRSPKWKPGLIHGKPVRVVYSIPITVCFSSNE